MRIFPLPATILLAGMLIACQTAPPYAPAPRLTPAPPATAAASALPPSATQFAPAEVSQRLLDEPTRRVLRFSNGFTALLQQNKTAPVVATRIFIKAGSLTEQEHLGAGISHLVEHLVAGASSGKRNQAENTLLLLQMGNHSNAFTDADQSCYYITTTADKWPLAAELLVDMTTNSTFTRQQFDREFQVVQRELEMDEAQTDHVFYVHALTNRYLESPARIPIVGYKAAFQTLTYEDCQAYYRRMYVPDNMIISVAGDLDLDAAETCLLNQVKAIRRRPAPIIALPPEPPVTAPRRSVARGDVAQARIQWAFPTSDIYGTDLPATRVLSGVLGGGESSLLVRKLREELTLVATISSVNTAPRYVEGQLEINATLAPEKIPAAQDALWAVLDDLLKNGITDLALTRAKAQAAANLVFDNQTADQQAVRNAEDFLVAGNIDFTALLVQRMQAITAAQVLAAARKYITREHLLTTVLLPKNAPDPFAAKAAATAAADQVVVKRTVLDNGVTLLISRNPAAPLACFNLYTLGGLLAEDDSTNGIGMVMMNLLPRETASRSHAQITDFLDATGTSVVGTSGNNAFQLSMACLKDHAPDSFALFADLALHPKFSAAELAQVKHSLIFSVETATEDWSGEAYRTVRDVFYASSPYKCLPEGNTNIIDKLTPAQIAAHYNTYFLDPAHMVIAISGDIDPAAAAQWALPFQAIPPRNPTRNTYSITNEPRTVVKPTAKQSATVMFAYPGANIASADRDTLVLLKTYLGGYSSPSGSLLHETLRSKGLVYTVKVTTVSGPAGGLFIITALGEPKNADAIASTISGLIENLKAGNVPDVAFNTAKDQTITGKKLDLPTIADISSHQALNEVLGVGFDDDLKFADHIRALTKDALVRAGNKYLTTPTLVIMTPNAKDAP